MSDSNGSRTERYATSTRAVRAGIATDAEHGAVVPPIHLSSTFAFEGFGRPRTYDYTRSGNPTRTQLADALAQLEGGASAVVTSTGMSAVLLALQFAKPGDLVLAAHDCYGGTQRLLRALAGRGNFDVVFTDLTQPGAEAEIASRKPRILWVETPSNPLLRITDVRRVCAAARAVGSLVVVDNTFLSPALQQPLALGADLVVHSTTKYLNGHSDVVGGAVVAHDATLGAELSWWANCLGITGAPFDSFLTLRGVRTLFPRIAQHVENAQRVVEALSRHEAVACVHYPGLPSHPGHEIAKSQQSGFGAMVSFELIGGTPAVERFVNDLRCFTLAESLGGVESLIAHPATMTHASMDAAARASAGITDSLLRLSVGIEDGGDLVRDLTYALDRVASEFATPPAMIGRHRLASVAHTDVVLLGAGAIGRELIAQVGDPGSLAGSRLRVCGVIDRSGYLFNAGGLSARQLRALRAHKAAGGKLSSMTGAQAASTVDAVDAITRRARGRAILVDVTAAETTPALELALGRGWDLVLANKVPLAADRGAAKRLLSVAEEHGREILHEATVGAGLPVIDTLRKLIEAGDSVLRIEGCPSGTLGFLFGELGSGQPFSSALRKAIAAGYTEPDPRVDLSGLDVARKALILGRLIGFDGDLADVAVESLIPEDLLDVSRDEFIARLEELDPVWRGRVGVAQSNGTVLRYRASVTAREISVGLVAVTARDPLGSLNGTDNQFAFTTTRYRQQPLVITGPGAGAAVTAAGVLNDLLRLASERGVAVRARQPAVATRTASASAALRGLPRFV